MFILAAADEVTLHRTRKYVAKTSDAETLRAVDWGCLRIGRPSGRLGRNSEFS
jgi:hypothetical protein